MVAWVIGLSLAGLVIAYMMAPRYQRRWLTAARYFLELPRRVARERLRWGMPRPTRPFWLQLPVLLCLLLAILLVNCRQVQPRERLGVWLVLDSSASMTTRQGGQTRFQAAQELLGRVLSRALAVPSPSPPWFRLSSFDLALVTHLNSTPSPQAVRNAAAGLQARSLGTDLDLVRRELAKPRVSGQPDAAITHLVVFTDQPAPDWALAEENLAVLWLNVAKPAPSHGFTAIDAVRHPLSGETEQVNVEVTACGPLPDNARLIVAGPNQQAITNTPLAWQPDGRWQGSFTPAQPGRYRLRLVPDDAYNQDNRAVLTIPSARETVVQWDLPDRFWPERLGWSITNVGPDLYVSRELDRAAPALPSLWVGDGFQPGGAGRMLVKAFEEANPILADVNLDALEEANWQGRPRSQLPADWQVVLSDLEDRVLVATRRDPPGVFLLGIPGAGDDLSSRVAQALFFNSVRWLLGQRSLPPLYGLTSPAHPEPDDDHLVLHPGEGDTSGSANRPMEIDFEAKRAAAVGSASPVWQVPLLLAVLFLAVERVLAAWGGRAWQ